MTTTRTAPADPAGDLAAAQREADEAARLAAALEERVRDGDDSVTAGEVDEAHKLSRFARLRREAAERKAAAARADMVATARREHAAQIKTAVASGALDVAPVAAAYARMRAAVDEFVTAANTYNRAWAATRDAIDGPPYRDEDGPLMDEFGVRMVTTVTGHPQIEAGGVRRYRLRTAEHIARAAVEAADGISPRYGPELRPVLGGAARHASSHQPDLTGHDHTDGEAGR